MSEHSVSATPDPAARGQPPETDTLSAQAQCIPEGGDVLGMDLALEQMEIGIFEWDVGSGVYRFSQRCRSFWGFGSQERITPETMLRRVHPEDRAAADETLAAAAAGTLRRFSIEMRILQPAGAVRWLHLAARTQLAEDASLRGYGAMRDITELRVAEHKLQERSSQLRAFVESAPMPIALLDSSLRFVVVSHRYLTEHAVMAPDIIGKSIYEAFPDMPVLWRDRYERALGGAVQRGETDKLIWLRREGERDWLRWEMRPWYRAGNEVGGVIMFAEFLTLSMEEQQLRDSQARLELAVHAGQLGIFEHDFTTQRATWNERLSRLFEFVPGQPVTYEQIYQRIHPADREGFARVMQQISAAGPGMSFKLEHRIMPPSGAVQWIAAIGGVTRDPPQRLVGVSKDISSRKRTELALEQSAAELRRVDERKNGYLATLSHELRGPLTPIRTAAHLLDSPKLTGEQLKWVAQVINRQTAQMTALLDDLLDITRISRGKLTLRKTQVALTDITRSALETVQPAIDAKGHHLVVSLPGSPLMVHADPLRMAQVLSNLLTNAARYTDPGGQIALSAAVEGDRLLIRVRDNGIGIPRESIGKIFTLFWQGDSSLNPGGLGVGLAFAQAIVQLHGGILEAHSSGAGQGTEISVCLPLKETAADETAAAAPGCTPASARRILAACSDWHTAGTLRKLINGHELCLAASAEDALAVAREFRPHLVLLELTLPGIDSLARLLRQEPWAKELRIIALTDNTGAEDLHRASHTSFDDQLTKPLDPDRLHTLLAR